MSRESGGGSSFSGISIPIMQHPHIEYYAAMIQGEYPASNWDRRWITESPADVFYNLAVKSSSFANSLRDALEYQGTICTMTHDDYVYTGDCFFNDPLVNSTLGTILEDGYRSTASFIYSVFRSKANGTQ